MTTFNGFEPANTTPVPDALFDRLLPELSGAELKVLLYIIRRTRGFKKETDAISLSQFTDGIKTRDGKQLDYGCGIKNRTVVSKALADLIDKGCIYSTKGKDPCGDAAVTIYAIRFNEGVVSKPYYPSIETVPPVVSKPYHGSNQSVPGVVSKPYPQETVLQDTDKQETVLQEREVADATARSQSSSQNDLSEETEKREAVKASQKGHRDGNNHLFPGSNHSDTRPHASIDIPSPSGDTDRVAPPQSPKDTNKVTEPPAPRKPPTNTVPKRPRPQQQELTDEIPGPEIPEKAIAIMDRWDSVHKKPAPRTLKTIQAAQLLMVYDPSEDELRECEKWLYTTDRPGKPWYRSHGVHLPDIAEKIGSWQSLQNAPPAKPEKEPSNEHKVVSQYSPKALYEKNKWKADAMIAAYEAQEAAKQGVQS